MYNIIVKWPDGLRNKVAEVKTLKEVRRYLKDYFAACLRMYDKYHKDTSLRRFVFLEEVSDSSCVFVRSCYDGPDEVFSCFCNF